MHCAIFNVIPEGQRIFLIRIVPSRLAVILLPEQEGLAVPGDRIRAGLGDGIPVIVGIFVHETLKENVFSTSPTPSFVDSFNSSTPIP